MRGPFVTGIADDEIIEAVFVPLLGERARWSYYKVVRKTGEFAKAIGAIVLDPARNYARVLCGAVEARPIVLAEASRALLAGSRVEAAAMADREVAAALGAHDAAFRRMHRTAVERAFNELPA
jgi:carbon-monoxide dehydrogenase medium subunit